MTFHSTAPKLRKLLLLLPVESKAEQRESTCCSRTTKTCSPRSIDVRSAVARSETPFNVSLCLFCIPLVIQCPLDVVVHSFVVISHSALWLFCSSLKIFIIKHFSAVNLPLYSLMLLSLCSHCFWLFCIIQYLFCILLWGFLFNSGHFCTPL